MSVKKTQRTDGMEMNIQQIVLVLWRKSWLIALSAIICAAASFLVSFYLITPKYQSAAMFYINNNSFAQDGRLSASDITVSKDLVDSYIVILNTRETLNWVIDHAGIDKTYQDVQRMISAKSVEETEVFQVVVNGTDPEEVKKIADSIAHVLPKRFSSIIEGTSAMIVDYAVQPVQPSSPNVRRNAVTGFMFGFVFGASLILLKALFDVTVRTEDDITAISGYPVLAAIPDMSKSAANGGNSSAPGRKKKKWRAQNASVDFHVGEDMSHGASEAYKLLGAKLRYSFADVTGSYVIGVSSAMAGEGKSTTAINLAHSFAQMNGRVLLIDGDLRRSTISEKTALSGRRGLTDYLTRQAGAEDIIQNCKLGDVMFSVISAGSIAPPNPMELLSSKRMGEVVQVAREFYDYVILDLPPVGEVSDALAVSKLVDGVLCVARQHYCNKLRLGDAVQQFEYVNAHILGVVMNCAKAG